MCQTAPEKLEDGAIHILRVEVLSSGPTDGTYADEGYGQGEFDRVRLLEVVKSPIRWKRGLVFRVHPFSGKINEERNLAPEHLIVGKRYYLAYTYYLDEEPHGDSDLIGLLQVLCLLLKMHRGSPSESPEAIDRRCYEIHTGVSHALRPTYGFWPI